ncbi:MAG: carboxypeptidase-like regulatory domain-containing protein [Planctomycetota bacterium]
MRGRILLAALALIAAAVLLVTTGDQGPVAVNSVDPTPVESQVGTGERLQDARESSLAEEEVRRAIVDAEEKIPWRTGDLLGCVVDEDGAPIPGAKIELSRYEYRTMPIEDKFAEALGALLSPRVTGADGRFRFERLPALGFYSLSVAAERFVDRVYATSFQVTQGRSFDFGEIVLLPEAQIVGQVVDEKDAPIAFAAVKTWGGGALPTTTDENGRFQLRGMRAGDYSLEVQRDGFAPLLPPLPFFHLDVGQTINDVRVRLSSGRALTGRVVDETGTAIAGVQVQSYVSYCEYLPNGDEMGGRATISESSTDADGRFRILGLTTGEEFSLVAHAKDLPVAARTLTAHPGDGSLELEDIVLVRPPTVSVVLSVFDRETARPLTPSRISVCLSFDQYIGERHKQFGPDTWAEPRSGWYAVSFPQYSAQSWVSISVSAAGYRAATVVRAKVGPDPIEVPMTRTEVGPRGGLIEGVVRNDSGTPIPDAWVALWGAPATETGAQRPNPDRRIDRRLWDQVVSRRTGADGTFRFDELPANRYSLRVSRPERGPVWVDDLRIEPGTSMRGLGVVLADAAGSITGSVIGLEGEPARGIKVIVFRPDGEFVTGETDESGVYRVASLAAGPLRLTFFGPGDGWRWGHLWADHPIWECEWPDHVRLYELNVEPGTEHRLDFDLRNSHLCTLKGTVLVDGKPIPRLRVRALGKGTMETRTDRSGRFTLGPVTAGEMRVCVLDESGTLAVKIVTLAAGEIHRLDFEIETARLEAVVLDGRDGRPVSPCSVQVMVRDEFDSEDPWGVWDSRHTRDDGTVVFERVPVGRLQVQTYAYEQRELSDPVVMLNLRAGESRKVVLYREPLGALRVRAEGAPEGCYFSLRRADGWEFETQEMSFEGGSCLLELAPGALRLVLLAVDGRELGAADVTVISGETREVTLEIEDP